jgi:hypothetical protein
MGLTATIGAIAFCVIVGGALGMREGQQDWLVFARVLSVLYLCGTFIMTFAANRWSLDQRSE